MSIPTVPRILCAASLAALFLLLPSPATAVGGPGPGSPATATDVDAEARARVIDAVLRALEERYVYPDVAAQMTADLRRRQAAGEYDGMDDGGIFARALMGHLRGICHDGHLGLRYSEEVLPRRDEHGEPDPRVLEREREAARRRNYGFAKVEHLRGNVGYLDLRGFMSVPIAGETACAAMTYLANSDALVVDLRQNGGGAPAMVAFLSTYLFGPEPVHLNDLYDRAQDTTHQWWTLPHVPGRRLGPDAPVFVLTSSRTFSAAEEFTYNLKNLQRATIVGETTGGGAHPVDDVRIDDHFSLRVPFARAINPISGKNWEGTGVEPDVAVPSELALLQAHALAVEALYEQEEDRERKGVLGDLYVELADDLAENQ